MEKWIANIYTAPSVITIPSLFFTFFPPIQTKTEDKKGKKRRWCLEKSIHQSVFLVFFFKLEYTLTRTTKSSQNSSATFDPCRRAVQQRLWWSGTDKTKRRRLRLCYIGERTENQRWRHQRGRQGPQATNLFLVVEPLFVAVSACDWYPMITFGGTPNLSL